MDKQNIITRLIEQHINLKKELSSISDLLTAGGSSDANKILDGLNLFKEDLAVHLKLENEVFYVKLLSDMKKQGQDITKTEQFIGEMKKIGITVEGFLSKFSTTESIEGNLEEFAGEFKSIVETLALRIESEESGVFSYWGLF